jgi:hypothetical protein
VVKRVSLFLASARKLAKVVIAITISIWKLGRGRGESNDEALV